MQFNLKPENIKYIKIDYRDNQGYSHLTKAAIKNLNEREILAYVKYEEEFVIQTPQEVVVSFVCENGLYKAKTQLKHVDNSYPYILFTLQTPEKIEFQQNREYFRIRSAARAVLSFQQTTVSCKVYDISANGICLQMSSKLDFPSSVSINILYPDTEIKTIAKFVRWDNEDDILKASFEFLNINEHDRDIISQKCIQKQLENRRKSIM